MCLINVNVVFIAGFIRKVYSILLCQLLVTIAAICIFLYV